MTPRLPWSDYLALDAANWSTLRELRHSPKHYRWRKDNPRPDVKSTSLGRATHAAVFEPDRFDADYIAFPGRQRRGKVWDAFQAEHTAAGRTIVTKSEYAVARDIREAVAGHALLKPYLERGRAEHTIRWTDPETGIACKARADWIADRRHPDIVDLKTCTSAEFAKFQRDVTYYGYYGQGGFYTDGMALAEGLPMAPGFVLAAVESEPPYDIAVYRVDEEALAVGRAEYRTYLHKLAECRRRDNWPGRYEVEQVMYLPEWKVRDAPPLDAYEPDEEEVSV